MNCFNYIGRIEEDQRLKDSNEIIIYGAGKVGRHVLEYLKKNGMEKKITCFCDNNSGMQGTDVQGIPVLPLGKATRDCQEGTYLVASMCVRQMVESLLQYGIEDVHIIRES